ncbi:hypothetical protein ACTFIU_006925 [Dictyostelium citrinum]
MNKIIYLFFILFIFGNFGETNCQTFNVPPNQYSEAIQLLALTKGPSYNAVCTWLTCAPLNDGSGNYTVTTINLSLINGIKSAFLDIDFSVFVNVTSIKLGQGIYPSKLFDSLTKLTSLTVLDIDTFNSTYTDSLLVMPKTMYQIKILNIGTKLGINFFNSPAYYVSLSNGLPGYQLPSTFTPDFPVNENLLFLDLPVRPGSGFPSNIGSALKNLKNLQLYIQNGKFDSSYTDFDFPVFATPFSNLTKLSIQFINFDRILNLAYPYQSWPFPSNLLSVSNSLNEFYIYNNGFNKSLTESYLDFSFVKVDNFTVIFSGGDNRYFSPLESCNYLRCSTKPCLKLPPNTRLSLNWCYLNISTFDFKNVSKIQLNNNRLHQTFPVEIFNFDQENFYIDISNNNFTGTVAQEFCYLKIGNFYFGNNDFTNVPTCFSCLGTRYFGAYEPLYVSVNPYGSNFPEYGTTCNTFNFTNQFNNVAKTDGSTVLTIYGNDFGWFIKDPLYLRVGIPNKYLLIYVPMGIGRGEQASGFFPNDRYLSFNYTYEEPVITSFSYNSTRYPKLLIGGTGFNFIGGNNVSIDGVVYSFSQANRNQYNGSIFPTVSMNNFPNGNKFTVSINVSGNQSKNVTFYLDSSSGGGSTTSSSTTTSGSTTTTTTSGSTTTTTSTPTTGSTTAPGSQTTSSKSSSIDDPSDHPSSSSIVKASLFSFIYLIVSIIII